MAQAEDSAAAAGTGKVDPAFCDLAGASLVLPYDCMLNQVQASEMYFFFEKLLRLVGNFHPRNLYTEFCLFVGLRAFGARAHAHHGMHSYDDTRIIGHRD